MKFGDKYELLESLTTGVIETFVANDKVRGERVLVHILDCAPQKPGQSTSEWVLESFRRVAPEPCGPVLETGKYSGTQYAYLVTKPPDETAQKSWVRRYEIQGQDTQETKPLPKPIEISVAPIAPLPPPPTKEPSRTPVSVTQLLRDFDSQIKPAAKPVPPAQPLPNLSLGGESSGLHSAPPWEPVRSPFSSTPKEDPRTLPPASSREYKDKGFPSSTFPSVTAAAPKDNSKPGEFTSFFQGPFRGDGPSDLPSLSSQPIEPPSTKVGDFTAVFGSMGSNPEQGPAALEESGNIPAPPTSFTGMFKDMERPPRTFNTSTPLPPPPSVLSSPQVETLPEPAKSKESFLSPAFVSPTPSVAPPTPGVLPTPPVPNVPDPKAPVARPSTLPGDGATGAFQQPSAKTPTPVMPEAPVGPSPYTQIISREKLTATSADTSAENEVAASPARGKVAVPAMPKIPGVTPPKMPPVRMPPPPPMPKVAAPKAPKLPKVEVPTPPPVSMMPLVITLAVIFLLGVLLVLYFVLKH